LFLELKITKRWLKVNKGVFVQNKKQFKISSFIPSYNNLVFMGLLKLKALKTLKSKI